MKKHLLTLGASLLIALTSCAGSGASFGEEQQNIIKDGGKDLKGKIVLNIASRAEVDKAYAESIENMKEKPSGDEAKAYWYDTARLVGKDLGYYKYEEGDTSMDLSIDICNGELAKYMKQATTEDPYPVVNYLIDDAYLQLYFETSSSKYKTFDNSECTFTLRALWIQNGAKRNEPLETVSFNKSSIKARTNVPLIKEGIKEVFGVATDRRQYPSNISEYKIKLSGTYEANYKDN